MHDCYNYGGEVRNSYEYCHLHAVDQTADDSKNHHKSKSRSQSPATRKSDHKARSSSPSTGLRHRTVVDRLSNAPAALPSKNIIARPSSNNNQVPRKPTSRNSSPHPYTAEDAFLVYLQALQDSEDDELAMGSSTIDMPPTELAEPFLKSVRV